MDKTHSLGNVHVVRSIGVFVCVHVKWVRSWIMPRFVEIAGVNTISHTQSCSGRAAGSKICERPPRGPGEARLDIAAPNKAGGAGVVSPEPPTPLSRRTDHLTDVGMRRRRKRKPRPGHPAASYFFHTGSKEGCALFFHHPHHHYCHQARRGAYLNQYPRSAEGKFGQRPDLYPPHPYL